MDELDRVRQYDNFNEQAFARWSPTGRQALDDAIAAERLGTPLTIIEGDLEIVANPYVAVPRGHGFQRRRAMVLTSIAGLVLVLVAGTMANRPTPEAGTFAGPGRSSTSTSVPGGPCRLVAPCAMPANPQSVALVPVPAGWAVKESGPTPESGTLERSVEVTYQSTATTPSVLGDLANSQLTLRLVVSPGAARAEMEAAATSWQSISIGSRPAKFNEDPASAGPTRGGQLAVVLNDDAYLLVTAQGLSGADLRNIATSVTVG